MKKAAPTLADDILRFSFNSEWRSIDGDGVLQRTLPMARKFVLDDKMSAFLGDLGIASLLTTRSAKKALNLLDSMRHLSRLPHRLMWVEYNNMARINRVRTGYSDFSQGILDMSQVDDEVQPDRVGWLFEQHPQIETAFRGSFFYHYTEEGFGRRIRPDAYSVLWCSEDHPLPWSEISQPIRAPQILTGIFAYRSLYVAVGKCPVVCKAAFAKYNEFVKTTVTINPEESKRNNYDISKLAHVAGEIRYIWALLSTINTLPVTSTFVAASKGYVAKGRYRKFVDHAVITLNVPETRYKRIASRAIAAARRRAHEVRGHWRKDWRHPGERIWIHEHQRGDASLGFVTHDYEVKHEEAS